MANQCIIERFDKVLLLTINRPPLNTLSRDTLYEIRNCLDEVENDKSIRTIIITGSGEKMFSAGADVTEFADMSDPEKAKVNIESIHTLFTKIEEFPKPIIACVNGQALGGGNELQMACHLVIASDEAKFGLPEVKLGIIPGYGGTQRLPRLIGKRRATELLLSGEKISAQQALEYGLINKVVPHKTVKDDALKWARTLADGAPLAFAGILESVYRGMETTIENGIMSELENVLRVSRSQDAIEGISAFFTKREPVFRGE